MPLRLWLLSYGMIQVSKLVSLFGLMRGLPMKLTTRRIIYSYFIYTCVHYWRWWWYETRKERRDNLSIVCYRTKCLDLGSVEPVMREARTAATDKGERFEVQGPSCADHERSWQVHTFILENGMGGHNI